MRVLNCFFIIIVFLFFAHQISRAGSKEPPVNPDRIEAEERDFHEKVRSGFLSLARGDGRWWVVDGTAAEDALCDQLRAAISGRFPALEWLA